MRKTFIRTLTFFFGLYFVLEFLLPKEIGGNFDKTALRAPSVLYDAEAGEYRMYYVGVYNRRTQAVGLATSTDGISWERYGGNPVMRYTLFDSADRLGFSSLSPVKTDDGYELYYLGHDMDTPPHLTICWATSADGIHWEKHGQLDFKGETPWRQYEEIDKSAHKRPVAYTRLQAITAAVVEGEPVLFIAHGYPGSAAQMVRAERGGADGRWVVESAPLPLKGLTQEQKIASLSFVEQDGAPELWMYLTDKTLYRARLAETLVAEFVIGKAEKEEEAAPEEPVEATEQPEEAPPEEATEEPGLWPFAQALAVVRAASAHEELDPFDKIEDMVVFTGPEGYRLAYARETGGKTAEDEVMPMTLYTIGSADGATWELPTEAAYFYKTVPLAVDRGAQAQPTYLSRGFKFMGELLTIIGAFAIGLGGVNMGILHVRKIVKSRKGVHNSAVFLACFVFMFLATMLGRPIMDKIREVETSGRSETEKTAQIEEIKATHSPIKVALAGAYNFVFYNVQAHLGATLFSLVSFYMVGAAFRSFRVKSAEAGFLILSATIVLIGQIPLGTQISSWVPWISGKLLIVVNAAAYRAVVMGMAIAAISTSVRLWLGLEKGMFHGT